MLATLPGKAAQAIRAYQSELTETALVERHLTLVKTTVDRMRIYLPASLDIEDLYSVGFSGLVTAARKFDPTQGAAFTSYATLHIRGAVHDELRRMDWTPRSVRDKARKFKDALNSLEQRMGRLATESEICAELRLSPSEYEELMSEIKPASFMPLDGEVFSEDSDSISLHEVISDENQTTGLQQLERKELLQLVVAQLQKLADVPRKVLALYYLEDMRLAEIATILGVTEGRVSQIHTQAVLSLRAFIKRQDNSAAA
jgi:RNA polymerase sigma factor FliA